MIVGSALQSEAWQEVEEACGGDETLLTETFEEMARGSGRPTARWAMSIVDRCKAEGCRPGQWRGGGKPRASPGEYQPGQDAELAEYTRVALESVGVKQKGGGP